MKKHIILLLLLVYISESFGQSYHNLTLENGSSPVLSEKDPRRQLKSDHFFRIKENVFKEIKEENISYLNIETPRGTFKARLSKLSTPLVAWAYTEHGPEEVRLDNFVVLKGQLIGIENSRVKLLVYSDGQIHGNISIDKDQSYRFDYYLNDETGESGFFFFNEVEIEHEAASCGTVSNGAVKQIAKDIQQRKARVASGCHEVNIAVEGDYEYYQIHGSTSYSKIVDAITEVNSVFSSDFSLNFVTTYMAVWTSSADPYTSTSSPVTLLSEFSSYWNSNRGHVPRDLAYLFTGRALINSGETVLGRAYINSACSNSSEAYGVASYKSGETRIKKILVHEITHNLGGEHTIGVCPIFGGNESVMCEKIISNDIVWYQAELDVVNYKLSSTVCFQQPNVYPTVNSSASQQSNTICGNAVLSLNNSTGASYSWYVDPAYLSGNGSISPSGNNATVNIWAFYRVVGQITDQCGKSYGHTFYLNPCMSSSRVKVFPNSVDDYFDIKFSDVDVDFNEGRGLSIYNENGVRVDFIKETERLSDRKFRVKLFGSPSGIYFLHISNKNQVEKVRLHLK